METKQLTVSRDQNKLVRKLLESEATAYKNWIVAAVEANDLDRAKRLTVELRQLQELFHTFKPDDMFSDYCR